MRLESVRDLKQELLAGIVEPFAPRALRARTAGARAIALSLGMSVAQGDELLLAVGAQPAGNIPAIQRSLALGVAPQGKKGFRLAIRLQRLALHNSPLVEHLRARARGEVDIRLVGRIDKRTKRVRATPLRQTSEPPVAVPWYRANIRPLLIGASVGHVDVTAGTIGAFVRRSGKVGILSNNHVLANEDAGSTGDPILQRAAYDGGKPRTEEVARLSAWVRLKRNAANAVDAAFGVLNDNVEYDAQRLRGAVSGRNRTLKGTAPQPLDAGDIVYKIGRTTGATKGRVTAFDLDNLVVAYDAGNLRFDGQIEIEGAGDVRFSDGGDSGSLIVNSRMEAVALLFAGGDMGGRNGLGLTFANPIHKVLDALKATLLP